MAITGDVNIKTIITISPTVGESHKVTLSTDFTDVRVAEWDVAVPASTVVVAWQPNLAGTPVILDDPVGFIVISTDIAIEGELTVKDGDAAEELTSFRLPANGFVVLTDGQARYSHGASDVFAGTLGNIDKIRLKEVNGSPAEAHIILGKVA